MMVRVLYLVSTLENTGPSKQLYNIIRNLDRTKVTPYLVTLSPEPKNSLIEHFLKLGITIHSLGLSRVSGLFFAFGRLSKLVISISPDIVHSQGVRADVLSSLLRNSASKVSTVRNFPKSDLVMAYGRIVGSIMCHLQMYALKRMDICIGVSSSVAQNLVDMKIERVQVILNGCDVSKYSPIDFHEKRKLRNELKLGYTSALWLVLGPLIDRKNPQFLIDSWNRLSSSDDVLLFVGDGDLMSSCEALSIDTKRIVFLGSVNDPVKYIQACDFYISSSKAEGLPNAALESMACGLPVLLSDIPPHMELFDLNKNIGCVYRQDSFDDFSRCIRELKNTDYWFMSQSANSLVVSKLSDSVMSSNYQDLYWRMING